MDLLEVLWFWCLLHGVSPCVSVAVLSRDAKAFDGMFILLFASCSQPCLAMATAMGLCGCVFVARVASPAVAPSLCWWGRRRATASVEWRPSGRGKTPTSADGDGVCCGQFDEMTLPVSHPTEMDEGRTGPLSLPSIPQSPAD
ncbi:putative retrotransposon hot spot (RHS) protein [Trypanosoma cruzi]|nr:putative retrotransposon hot spot (RHS) protein [Trypanosoma cruzi]